MRIFSIPFIVYFLILHKYVIALCVLCGAMVTDLLDGWLARKLNQKSKLGALLDPLADKLMVVSVYGCFLYDALFSRLISHCFVAAVIIKEVCLLAGAFWIMLIRKQIPLIRPSLQGKYAMWCHSALIILIVFYKLGWGSLVVIHAVMWIALIISYWALVDYVKFFLKKRV